MLGLFLSRRWEMAIMLFSGAMVAYTLRVNMSVAVSKMSEELGWSTSQQGLALSSFYWGYTVGQLPAARMVQQYGAKWIFGLSVLLSSIATLFTPIAAKSSFGLLLFMRCLIGIFESLAFPAIFQFIPIWIPLEEKTLMVPFIYSGMYIGTIVSFSVSSALLDSVIMMNDYDYGSWDACFYLFGLLGIAWFPYWSIMAYETPKDHPSITQEELTIINEGKHFPGEEEITDLMTSTRAKRSPSFSPIAPSTLLTEGELASASQDSATGGRVRKGSAGSNGSGSASGSLQSSPAQVKARKYSQQRDAANTNEIILKTTEQRENDGDFADSEKDDQFNVENGQLTGGETEDDEDPEHSYPISLESVAHNMIKTRSSKKARLDGKLSHMSSKSSRPRKLTIVTESKMRQSLASHIPWKNFFTHPVSITLFVNCWVDGFIGFTLLSEMPLFLQEQFNFNLQSAGVLCVFPYLALFISTLGFGIVFELLSEYYPNLWTTDTIRKSASFIGYGGAAIGLIICSFMSDKYIGYAFMILTQFVLGASSTGLGCAFSDVAPNYSSALNTVGNTISAIAGIIGPLVISGLLQDYPGSWGWRYAFFVTAGQVAIALIMWYCYQTSQPVPALNEPSKED